MTRVPVLVPELALGMPTEHAYAPGRDSESVEEACRALGRRLAAYRHAAGYSQAALASVLTYSRSTIANVETGRQHVPPNFWSSADAALVAGGELIEAYNNAEAVIRRVRAARQLRTADRRPWKRETKSAPDHDDREHGQDLGNFLSLGQEDDEVMRRRAFLLNVAVLAGMGKSDPVTALETLRREVRRSFADGHGAEVSEWNEIALEYGETYAITVPAELLKSLIVDFAALQDAFQRYPQDTARQELYRVSALLAGFLAQTVNNLGHVNEARRWWRTARYAADRSGDSYSALWVRGREIVHAMGERPITAVLRLIDEAERFVGDAPPEVALELLAGKAQALAMADRGPEAEDALTQLHERFSATSFAGYSGSLLAWGEERLRNTETFTYSRLGNYKRFESAQLAASALYKHDPSNVRWPTGVELNRAFCLARNGDVTEGIAHAQRVIAELPAAQQTRDMLIHGRDVLNAIPQAEGDRPVVNEYREWLESTFWASTRQSAALPAPVRSA